jgi:choline transport protein
VFAWIINCAGPSAIISNIITALATFNYETYQPKAWHTTLIMWGLILVPFVFNLWFRQLLNTFELLGGLLHTIFFIASIITLAVLARRSTPDFVFNTLTTGQSGWTNPGVSWGLGLLTVTFAVSGAEWHPSSHFQAIDKVLGFDGVLHMSKDSLREQYVEPTLTHV